MSIKNPGGLSIFKGHVDAIPISMWDAIPVCDPACRIFTYCPHNSYPDKLELNEAFHANVNEVDEWVRESCTELCSLRKRYLNSVYDTLVKSIPEKDDMKMHVVGMMLIPLYSALVTFKIAEYSMRGQVYTGRGINPVYKEMRETIKTINGILKEINLQAPPSAGYVNGDEGYYESLMADGEVVQP